MLTMKRLIAVALKAVLKAIRLRIFRPRTRILAIPGFGLAAKPLVQNLGKRHDHVACERPDRIIVQGRQHRDGEKSWPAASRSADWSGPCSP